MGPLPRTRTVSLCLKGEMSTACQPTARGLTRAPISSGTFGNNWDDQVLWNDDGFSHSAAPAREADEADLIAAVDETPLARFTVAVRNIRKNGNFVTLRNLRHPFAHLIKSIGFSDRLVWNSSSAIATASYSD